MTAESPEGQEDGESLAARVNERHEHGDSMFVEPTPREVHEIMEEAAADPPRQ